MTKYNGHREYSRRQRPRQSTVSGMGSSVNINNATKVNGREISLESFQKIRLLFIQPKIPASCLTPKTNGTAIFKPERFCCFEQ